MPEGPFNSWGCNWGIWALVVCPQEALWGAMASCLLVYLTTLSLMGTFVGGLINNCFLSDHNNNLNYIYYILYVGITKAPNNLLLGYQISAPIKTLRIVFLHLACVLMKQTEWNVQWNNETEQNEMKCAIKYCANHTKDL